MGLGTGVRILAEARDFSLLHYVQTGSAPNSPLLNGYLDSLPGYKVVRV
jgi:hypothetical protein